LGAGHLEEPYHVELNDTWIWDGSNWQQQYPINSPSLRTGHQMIYDRARQVVLLFGGTVQGAIYDDTWIWDGKNWIEQHPTQHPSARTEYAMGYDEERNLIVLFGGYSVNGLENDTWIWDGQDWMQLKTIDSPPVEIGLSPKMIYLPNKKMHILYSIFRKKTLDEKGVMNNIIRSEVWGLR